MKFLCIQQVAFEPPGNIRRWADEHNHQLEILKIYNSCLLTPIDEFDGLILLGGPMSVNDNDKHPWLKDEFTLIEQAMRKNKRLLGICLGAQILAKILGAKVGKMGYKEIGFFPVCLTETGVNKSKCFTFVPRCFMGFHWHGEMFSIPEGALHIATSKACQNQAFEYDSGRVLALQFHLETNRENLFALVANGAEELRTGGDYVQRMEYMHDTLDRISSEYYKLLVHVLDNWSG